MTFVMKLALLGAGAGAAQAFAPSSLPLFLRSSTASARQGLSEMRMNENLQSQQNPWEKVGTGLDAYDRSRDDWGGGTGTGGASGKLPDGPSSFEDYMKRRAAEGGGKVEVAGIDVTDVKPSYKCVGDWDGSSSAFNSASAASYEDVNSVEEVFEDKSVSGFGKQDTDWLYADDTDLLREREQKQQAMAAEQDEIEAKMAMWMQQAAEKKAREGGN